MEADKVYGLIAYPVLPSSLAALAVAGGFTAAMSTVNAMVFGNTTYIADDLYGLPRPTASAKELIGLARACVATIMAVYMIVAWNPNTPLDK